jgi:hypothetical protein
MRGVFFFNHMPPKQKSYLFRDSFLLIFMILPDPFPPVLAY